MGLWATAAATATAAAAAAAPAPAPAAARSTLPAARICDRRADNA